MRNYSVTDTFDIKTGMSVFDSEDRKIGIVTRVAGFGAQQVGGGARTESSITRASAGTGSFDVDQRELGGAGSQPLCLSFGVIDEVIEGKGVILTVSAATLTAGPKRDLSVDTAAPAKSRGFRFWRRSS